MSDDAVSTFAVGRSEGAQVAPAVFAARPMAVSMSVRLVVAGVSDCQEKNNTPLAFLPRRCHRAQRKGSRPSTRLFEPVRARPAQHSATGAERLESCTTQSFRVR
jgi:hypothetical protein